MNYLSNDTDWFIKQFRTGEPFAFSRWGDGEWRSVLLAEYGKLPKGQNHFRNCDGHQFFPAMNQRLCRILKRSPAYLLGFQPFAWRLYKTEIRRFVRKHLPDQEWCRANVFAAACVDGRFGEILAAMKQQPIMFVGPNYLRGIHKHVPVAQFVEVPLENCFRQLQRIIDESAKKAEKLPKGSIISITASMPANIVVDRLYRRLGDRYFIIDFGSVYDPFVGKNTRSQHRSCPVAKNLAALKSS